MNNADIIQMLRELGYSVKITHERSWTKYTRYALRKPKRPRKLMDMDKLPDYSPDSKGGKTTCSLKRQFPDGEVTYTGVAICNPKDTFVRKDGVKLALERAVRVVDDTNKGELFLTTRLFGYHGG